jgi:hypothetical protein
VSNLNIPQEKIYELGNYQTVATVRDIPDLTFDVESFDVSTEVEALLVGKDPTTTVNNDLFDFAKAIPWDVLSPFKDQSAAFTIAQGVVVPYLTLESAEYRFGVGQNSTQKFTTRGDSIYYVPGVPKQQSFTLSGGVFTYTFSQTALPYVESGSTLYALSACVKNPATGLYKRLFFGQDYTNTTTTITTLVDWFAKGYTQLHVTFGTSTAASYLQTVHQDATVKPAAVKGKDIDVYIKDLTQATPVLTRWTGVQSFDVTWRVQLQNDEEFGNHHYLGQDYDVSETSGTIAVKPQDATDMLAKLRAIANVSSTTAIIGPYSSAPLEMELRIKHPDTGVLLKTLYVPDARFTVPAVSDRVQTKLSLSLPFSSDSGVLKVYQGARP